MKVNIADLEKALQWLKENTHAISVDAQIDFERHLVLKAEDKYQKQIEIIIYSVDKDQQSLLKPTIKKTEQL
jgi:hypothetical protein